MIIIQLSFCLSLSLKYSPGGSRGTAEAGVDRFKVQREDEFSGGM